VLKVVLKDARTMIPDVVEAELRNGVVRHAYLHAVLEANWIEVVSLDKPEQLAAFAYYERRLVGEAGRNIGECGVLALAETTENAIAVVDDRVAWQAARARNVEPPAEFVPPTVRSGRVREMGHRAGTHVTR
jgi:predicted nucleic acid-binding protein